jgi:hypothetical protein
LALASLVLCSLVAGGCDVSGSSTTPAATSTTFLISVASAQHDFNAAKGAWVRGALAPSFQQSMYFSRVASLLSLEVAHGARDSAVVKSSIKELQQLATLPETVDSTLQHSEARKDLRDLNHFFATKGLYG